MFHKCKKISQYLLSRFRRFFRRFSHFLIPERQQRDCPQNIVIMRDGALPHITRAVQIFLTSHFTEIRIISRYFRTAWPPRLPDLTSCDFWLHEFLKYSESKDQCQTICDRKDSIRFNLRSISQDNLRIALENIIFRMECVIDNGRGIIEHA